MKHPLEKFQFGSLREKWSYSELLELFSCIRKLRMHENVDQNNSDYGHLIRRYIHEMIKHTQIIHRLLPTNCLGMFDHFVTLALKGLV